MSSINKNEIKACKIAKILIRSFKHSLCKISIYDASVKSGLSLEEAEMGLHYLLREYNGHILVTNHGVLLFYFPHGFVKSFKNKYTWYSILKTTKYLIFGILKFLMRSWISIVLISYTIFFLIFLLLCAFSRNDDSNNEKMSFNNSLLMHAFFRMILDSLFWTMHPLATHKNTSHKINVKKNIKFYDKINRFVFGPEIFKTTILEYRKIIIAEIVANNGRIGLLDIIKVTGFKREKIDLFMSTLILNYKGNVKVLKNGTIIYEFCDLRKTQINITHQATPIWLHKEKLFPLTGNSFGVNICIGGLNFFNLIMSVIAIKTNLVLDKLYFLFLFNNESINNQLIFSESHSIPLLFGWIPFLFSILFFMLPLYRVLMRRKEKTLLQFKNGRKGVLKAIITKLNSNGIHENILIEYFKKYADRAPTHKELYNIIINMGGEISVSNSEIYYNFKELETEYLALNKERLNAHNSEKNIGKIVFSSID